MSEPFWVPIGASSAPAWTTGDTKVSMQAASHDDPAGGRWLLADGSAIPGQYTALIAMAGPNLPDARGRTLVMLGAHADVNALNKNDGVALNSRSPKHKSSVTENPHGHGTTEADHAHSVYDPGHVHYSGQEGGFAGGGYSSHYTAGTNNKPVQAATTGIGIYGAKTNLTINTNTTGIAVGPAASGMVDTPAYTVVGNLFIHT